MQDEFRSGLAEALQVPEAEIREDMPLAEDWDSLALLSVIALIDQHYNVTVSGAELERCRTVGDILRLAQRS